MDLRGRHDGQSKSPSSAKGAFLTLNSARLPNRWLIFAVWVLLALLLFAKPVYALFQLASHDETASHILLIPFVTAWLLYTERKPLQPEVPFGLHAGMLFLVPSLLATILSLSCQDCAPRTRLSGYVLALVLLVVAGFVVAFGAAAAKSSSFALAFLLFAIPIPDLFLGKIIHALQAGSAAIAEVFFNLSGAPVLRQGFVFRLPVMSIEVAQECSGIRSSLALLILALLVAHFSFRALWKKLLFVAAGLCMMLLKNGIRIAALTLLANYVNPAFLTGSLHHQGGVVFFLIGLALLIPVYWFLRKGEVPAVPVVLRQQ
ncbi:MAG TPA: exosortase/archaeosortase family protein [Candidatus Acidoferrum sp.]|nr:exosortase/archaeosortase family protein [Candidatus Acidoferrum sp.]